MTRVGINQRTVVHADSGGTVTTMPDICLTPTPAGPPVPIPYPNVALSSDAASTASSVLADDKPLCNARSQLKKSSGDEGGSAGGVISARFGAQADFVSYSFDVKIEGAGAVRSLDLAVSNARNTPPAPIVQPPLPSTDASDADAASADAPWEVGDVSTPSHDASSASRAGG